MTKQEQLNEEIANAIRDFFIEHNLGTDTRIYFNNKAYHFDSSGKVEYTIEDIKPTDYFTFGNNETVSVSFEGPFYRVMNVYFENRKWGFLKEKFDTMIEQFGYYYELGDAWNLSLYEI